MHRGTLIFLLAGVAAFAQDGWISLFNGKDFTGWKVGGDQTTFKVKDGSLVANGPVAHAFYDGPVNNHDFKNFELMVDVKAPAARSITARSRCRGTIRAARYITRTSASSRCRSRWVWSKRGALPPMELSPVMRSRRQ